MNKRRCLRIVLASAAMVAITAAAWYGLGHSRHTKLETPSVQQHELEVPEPSSFNSTPPAQSWGSLSGHVTWRGELPVVKRLDDQIRMHPNSKFYLGAPEEHLLDPTWQVDAKTKGVGNVVLFLTPFDSKLPVPIHSDDKQMRDTAVLDVPYCNYVPHVSALYPEWRDETGSGPTGQRFFISCSSKEKPGVLFNFEVDPLRNQSLWTMMAPGQKTEVFLKSQTQPIVVKEFLLRWMKAYVWVFDHPYFAITKRDGSFTMPRVPAGIQVRVMIWHEARGWLHGKGGKVMTMSKDQNVCNAEMSALE